MRVAEIVNLDGRQARLFGYPVKVPCQAVAEWQRLKQARVRCGVRYRLDKVA